MADCARADDIDRLESAQDVEKKVEGKGSDGREGHRIHGRRPKQGRVVANKQEILSHLIASYHIDLGNRNPITSGIIGLPNWATSGSHTEIQL